MKMGKKSSVLSFLIVFCMLIVMFAGCSSDNGTDTTTTTKAAGTTANVTTTTAVTTEEDPITPYLFDPDKVYTINWMVATIATMDKKATYLQELKEYFKVDINPIAVDDNSLIEQVNLKMAAGEVPDVLPLLQGSQMQQFAQQGLLAEIPEVALQHYLGDYMENSVEIEPQVLDYYFLDGKRYALCNYFFMANLYRRPVVYNGTWMKNVGVSGYPKTIDEFEALMYKFAKEDPDGNDVDDTYGLSMSGLRAIWGISGFDRVNYWGVKDGHAVYGAVQEEMKSVIEMLSKWYEDGVLDPEFVTGENTGGYWAVSNAFTNGRIGMTSHAYIYHWFDPTVNNGFAPNYNEMAKRSQEEADNITFGVPPTKDGVGGIGGDSAVGDYWYMFGHQLNDDPELFGKILWYMKACDSTPDESKWNDAEWNLRRFYGEEDVQWKYDAEGKISFIEGWSDLPKRQSVGLNKMFNGISDPAKAYDEQKNMYDAMRDIGLGAEGRMEPLYPGCVVFNKLNEYKAELQKIEDEAYIAMITGDKDISYFDTFVADWMAAGGAEVTAEIDEWYQNKP